MKAMGMMGSIAKGGDDIAMDDTETENEESDIEHLKEMVDGLDRDEVFAMLAIVTAKATELVAGEKMSMKDIEGSEAS